MEGDEENEVGEEDDGPVDMQVGAGAVEIDIHGDEETELDEHLNEVGGDARQRHDESGEVDLSEDSCIGDEDIRGYLEAGAEIVPQHDTGEVEQGLWGAVGGDAGQSAEHEHIHDRGEDGLDDEPEGSEHGLFVDGDDIAFDVHVVEVAIAPQVLNIDVEPFFLWLYFNGPSGSHFN